jgi:hypothetical protein
MNIYDESNDYETNEEYFSRKSHEFELFEHFATTVISSIET